MKLKMKNKKVIIWNTGIDNLIAGQGAVGGLTVQLYFWAKTFVSRGWEVYSFSRNKKCSLEGIHFLYSKKYRFVDIIYNFFSSLYVLLHIRPEIVVCRGADRSLFWIALFAKVVRAKCLFFGASDVNFVVGKDTLVGNKINTLLYRRSLSFVSHIIVQNEVQKKTLQANYNRESLVIPNIWLNKPTESDNNKEYDVLWVANMRRLKRPEWFISLAKEMPNYKFAMVGGVTLGDRDYFLQIKKMTQGIDNCDFLGSLPFVDVNRLFEKVKILVCTSEYEGFPNTFLQAWANGVPVVSTVDPNNLLSSKFLGYVIQTKKELHSKVELLLTNQSIYETQSENIKGYFEQSHSAANAFDLLMRYIK